MDSDQTDKLAELKKAANEKYSQIKESMQYYQDLSKEYVAILKEIERILIEPRF